MFSKEFAFSKKRLMPAIVAGSLTASYAVVPPAVAEQLEQAKSEVSSEAKKAGNKGGEHAKKRMSDDRGEGMQAAVKDAWLDGKLETALLLTDELNAFAIDTKVENGVARLAGTVESDIDRDLAEEIANSIDGVASVENELKVDKQNTEAAEQSAEGAEGGSFRTAVSNAALTARIKSELLLNPNVSGLSVDVDSYRNVLTLNGSVDSAAAKELVEQIAQNAAGDRDVENNLHVE